MRTPSPLGTLAGVVLLVSLNGFGADKLGHSAVVGSIVGTQGTVQVDQHSVLPNEAVFAGDSISTGATSGAFLNLHGTIAILVEKSELALARSGDSVAMTLKKGALEIRNGQAQPAVVHVPGASVLVGSEGAFPSICRIASADQSAVVYAEKGHVEIHGTGAPTLVRPGQSVRLEAGVPQAAGQQAGKVSGHIPTGSVQHEGKGTLITLKLSDPIFWEDLVSTQDNGRIRIALEGGSYLNVGARSQMRIIQHDAQSQQTAVELKLGSLRGEVVKLTKGGKFETRTPTAVIGVVGTIYVVNANPQLTRVWSATGDVTVRNIDPNVPGEVTLHAGQTTSVQKGKPPESPSTAPANQLETQMAQTNVPEGALAGATAGGEAASSGTAGGTAGGGTAGGGASGGFPGGVTNMVTIGAAGGSVIAGGIALHEATQANNNAAAAQSALAGAANAAGQAAASAAAAQQAAAAALAAAQEANNIATTTANQINSILKGCGCVSPQSMLSAAQQATAAAQQAHSIATATANPNGSGSVSPTKP